MKIRHLAVGVLVCASITFASVAKTSAQDDLVPLIVELLRDSDKDIRALAFEQVRTEAPGETATKKFAALLPDLPTGTQVGLLSALADRGDKVAASAVRDLLANSKDEQVRVASIKSLGGLGEAADLPSLVKFVSTGTPAEQAAARRSLVVLPGEQASAAMAAELSKAQVPVRVMLMEVLTTRRARNTAPAILNAATDDDPDVRRAAMAALGQLGASEHVPGMVQAVLKAERGRERDAAEKAIMLVCHRTADPKKRAQPLLDAMDALSKSDHAILLSALGRVGGSAALVEIEAVLSDSKLHTAGLRALYNWPDASIAFRLLELARIEEKAAHRRTALRAMIRVAPLPDDRSDQHRLDLLRTAMAMCGEEADRLWVLDRARAVRSVQALRFIKPYMNQSPYTEQACLAVVDLAHHSGLREANKAEFHRALDQVILISKNATVVDRAQRYKKGETWVKPG